MQYIQSVGVIQYIIFRQQDIPSTKYFVNRGMATMVTTDDGGDDDGDHGEHWDDDGDDGEDNDDDGDGDDTIPCE